MKILFYLISISNLIKSHYACQLPNTNIQITSAHQNYSSSMRLKRSMGNLRIYVHYDESFNTLENANEFRKNVIEPAVKFWEKALKLKDSMNSPILIDRECDGNYKYVYVENQRLKICQHRCSHRQKCSDTTIPDQFLARCYIGDTFGEYSSHGTEGKGAENADLIIIIAHQSQGCQRLTVAASTTCQLEHILDRPILGLLNICPNTINYQTNLNLAIATIKHEIVHILGFSVVLFPFFRDKYGNHLTSRDSDGYPNIGFIKIGSNEYYKYSDQIVIEKKVQAIYRTGYEIKNFHLLITPNIKREARKHFNCPSLEGMVLEDYGSEHIAISHFERRLLQNEIMTAEVRKQVYISQFTMAFLQDTGWYDPDYKMANDFTFGKNAGCDFVFKTCYEYIKTKIAINQSVYPYCNDSFNSVKCSEDLTYISHCDLHKNSRSNVPDKFRYFDDIELVSSNVFSEYCPYYKEYTPRLRHDKISNGVCTDVKNNAKKNTKFDVAAENYGPSSKCFKFQEYDIVKSCKTSISDQFISVGCYKYRCSVFRGLLVIVGDLEYQCLYDGEEIEVELKTNFRLAKGKIICPQCTLLCNKIICSSFFQILPVDCSRVNRRCRKDTTWNLKCSGFQKDFEFSIIGFLLSMIFYLHFFELFTFL